MYDSWNKNHKILPVLAFPKCGLLYFVLSILPQTGDHILEMSIKLLKWGLRIKCKLFQNSKTTFMFLGTPCIWYKYLYFIVKCFIIFLSIIWYSYYYSNLIFKVENLVLNKCSNLCNCNCHNIKAYNDLLGRNCMYRLKLL